MPPAKTLSDHVFDRTFRASRHRGLLAGHVLRWPALAAIQARYVAMEHELERRAIAVAFERAVRAGPESEPEPSTANLAAELERLINMPPEPYDPIEDGAAAALEADRLAGHELAQPFAGGPDHIER